MTDSNSNNLITVIIPALNEAEGIGDVIDAVPTKRLAQMGYDVEVLVVDGESTDGTRDIAKSKGARVIVEPRKGYGRAYKTGFREAEGDVFVTGDADMTYPFDHIDRFVQQLNDEGLDFITTNRFAETLPGAMSAKHKFGNWVLSTTARVLFMVRFKDSQSGMWVFRREALHKLTLTSDGMPLSEEIKLEAFRHPEVEAVEIPIEYRPRVGEVKLSSWGDGWKNLMFLFRKRFGLLERPAEE